MAKSLKLNSDLWRRLEEYSAKAGFSSPEELVEHLIEQELSRDSGAPAPEASSMSTEMEKQLRGLGYLE
jgi:hypothetical protein